MGVLQLARYITFLLGIAALSTAMYYKALPQDLYGGGLDLGKGLNFITEVVALIFTVPLVAGMMGLKTDTRSFLVSSVSTVVMFVLSPYYLTKQWALPVAITTNLLSFFGTHYLQHKGFVVVRPTAKQYTGQLPSPTQGNTRSKLSSLLAPPPRKKFLYSQKRIEKYGSNPSLFALFIAFSYMIPFFMHSYAEPATYNWLLAVRGIGALLCVGLLLEYYWPKSLLSYFPSYYHFSLMYCLPFTASFIFFLEGSNVEWLINVALTIMFLIVLVDWLSFVMLTALGIALGSLFYTLAIGPIQLQLDFSTGYLLVYTCIFSTLIALIFARRREQHLEAKLREISDHHHTNRPTAADVYPAVCRIVTMIEQQVMEFSSSYRQQFEAPIQLTPQGEKLTTPDCLLYLFPTALEIIKQGADMDHHLVQEIKQAHIDPQANLLSLQTCVTSILENYKVLDQQYVTIDSTSKDYLVYASFAHLQYALIHVLRFIHAHDLDTGIGLKITQSEGIHIGLNGKSLPYASIQQLFSLFPAQTSAKHPGLAISRLLIEAHDGQLLCKTYTMGQSPYMEFVLFIPPAEVGTREYSSPT